MLRVVGARRVVRGHGRRSGRIGNTGRPRTCATGRAARSAPPYFAALRVSEEGRNVEQLVRNVEAFGPGRRRSGGSAPALASRNRGPPAGTAEAGRDHRHAYLFRHRVVDDGAEDDVRIRIRGGGDDLSGLVHLEESEVAPAGDVQQDAGRTVDRRLEQRGGNRRLRGLGGAIVAGGAADAHQCRTGLVHDRPHVGEVEVDQSGDGDQVGDALDALAQHFVGDPEGVEERSRPLDHLQETVVLDHDQRVDLLGELADALLGLLGAAASFERERPRDDTHGQGSETARDLRNDRCATGTCSAALAGGDEHHVRALERLLDLVAALLSRVPADGRIRAGAEAVRAVLADRELHVGVRLHQDLGVRVHGDEVDAAQAGVDHPRHRVGAAAADSDDLDYRQVIRIHYHTQPGSTSTYTGELMVIEPPPRKSVRRASSFVNTIPRE